MQSRSWTTLRIAIAYAALAVGSLPASTPAETLDTGVATYHVRFSPGSQRLSVTATMPIAGTSLRTADSRPAGIPELDSLGWAGLVHGLRVTDVAGHPRAVTRDRTGGWTLSQPDTATLRLEYDVDYSPLERMGWPAPREAAYRDVDHFLLVGRSLFITTAPPRECRVIFSLPTDWVVSAPWRLERLSGEFVASSPQDLVENLIVFTRGPRDVVTAGGFRLLVHALGTWEPARGDVRAALGPIARHHVRTTRFTGHRDYVVAFLPHLESGAESYRGSFALCIDSLPSPSNRATWANLVAHEMFHLWNGWILRGADYTSSQWFQEGFTEYEANRATASSGLVSDDWLRGKLARHVENARRLTTTMEETGGRKGPPLYSTGALVAFVWDVRIRAATHGRRDLGDFFRELIRRTDRGARAYAWPDLRAALQATAPGDWEAFYQSFIRAKGTLPVEQALATVGQRMVETPDGRVHVEADPAAGLEARRLWAELPRAR